MPIQVSSTTVTKSLSRQRGLWSLCVSFYLSIAPLGFAEESNPFVGIWASDDGFQIVELLFRSDGRYQLDQRSTDPVFDLSSTERGRYGVNGQTLTLTPYEYLGEPLGRGYVFELNGGTLTLHRIGFEYSEVYQFKPGSTAEVLAKEQTPRVLIGTWGRNIQFSGDEEFTFRPGGYYFRKDTHENSEFPPDYVRGRYEQEGSALTLKPYSGIEMRYELDFFGSTLTVIEDDQSSGRSAAYEKVAGSETAVRAKAAEAEAFLSQTNWQVGVWEIRDTYQTVDLTLRPDGRYIAKEETEFLEGIARGHYALEPGWIHLQPFVGQGLYARSNGDFGKVARSRGVDYYDGELQLIDFESLSQRVILARKRAGSEAPVIEKVRAAQAERARPDWSIGIWEVQDPAGWMEFTFRPDGRYIAKAGAHGTPSEVERGQYRFTAEKLTLAPYSGLGQARGFELDLYDGDLFLVGDFQRLVVARRVIGSETGVIEKTMNPSARQGERGAILGRWTANLPGQFAELVFRHDGEFRLKRCAYSTISHDYGLYSVDMSNRTLVYDSRFVPVQTQGLDFYGNTMTIYGGLGSPSTYTVNLGTVDPSIEASFAADAAEALIDAQWLARVPIAPRDPNAVQIPAGDIPADPNPGAIFNDPTVFQNYQLYRRLIPGFVYFNYMGSIRSVAVTHTREWHFFPTGRVLVRFKNYRAGVYPNPIADISDSWAAYHVGPKPEERDILHLYADNIIFIETDLGEQVEMTVEDGRRNLFWGKDYMILSEWATERQPIPCELPGNSDASLMNTGVSLSTSIAPDAIGASHQIRLTLTGPVSGNFTLAGINEIAGNLVIERTTSLAPPVVWGPVQTNNAAAGAFNFVIPQGTSASAFFRVRRE